MNLVSPTLNASNLNVSFQLKGSMLTITVLQLLTIDDKQFADYLKIKINSAPNFFSEIPLIIDCDAVTFSNADSLHAILQVCKKSKLKVIGIRCNDNNLLKVIKKNKLELLPSINIAETVVIPVEEASLTKNNKCKVIEGQVRSGVRIVAENSDLVVLSSVSVGAELIADGNIHVYGALCGRAYAGNNANNSAQIFCHSLQAELISIAGVYEVAENLCTLKGWGHASYISLDDDGLTVTSF